MKQKFDIIQSTCIPIKIDNCNTDLIIPAIWPVPLAIRNSLVTLSCTTSASMLRDSLWPIL